MTLAETFVDLADTLVDDYDVVDLLGRLAQACVQLCSVGAVGILLDDQRGNLALVASSTEETRLLELLQIQADQGPCLDCFRTGEPVSCPDLRTASPRWPVFAPAAVMSGFCSVTALPMRLRDATIGTLNLFDSHPRAGLEGDIFLAQAFADIATIGVLQQRSVDQSEQVAEQLQRALTTRVVIEQAKGMVAECNGTSVEESFQALRGYARNHNLKLSTVAGDVVAGALRGTDLARS